MLEARLPSSPKPWVRLAGPFAVATILGGALTEKRGIQRLGATFSDRGVERASPKGD